MAALKISQAVHTATDGPKRRGDPDAIVRGAAERVGVPVEPLVEIVALGGKLDPMRLATWKRRLVRFLDRATDFLWILDATTAIDARTSTDHVGRPSEARGARPAPSWNQLGVVERAGPRAGTDNPR